MTWHVDLAVHALFNECFQVHGHVGLVNVLLGSLLNSHQISPVINVKNFLDMIPQGPGDDHPCFEIAVMVGYDLHVVLKDG